MKNNILTYQCSILQSVNDLIGQKIYVFDVYFKCWWGGLERRDASYHTFSYLYLSPLTKFLIVLNSFHNTYLSKQKQTQGTDLPNHHLTLMPSVVYMVPA